MLRHKFLTKLVLITLLKYYAPSITLKFFLNQSKTKSAKRNWHCRRCISCISAKEVRSKLCNEDIWSLWRGTFLNSTLLLNIEKSTRPFFNTWGFYGTLYNV